jgi:uncharacterized coiled-coil protein SlyX
MVKFLENKQILHIVGEVIVITGLALYFNNKNKKLTSHIEDLSQRIEDLEENFQKQETLIKSLVEKIQKQEIVIKQTQKLLSNTPKVNNSKSSSIFSQQQSPPSPSTTTTTTTKTPRVAFKSNIVHVATAPVEYILNRGSTRNNKSRIEEIKEEDEEISEDALDEQLESELADLDEVGNKTSIVDDDHVEGGDILDEEVVVEGEIL